MCGLTAAYGQKLITFDVDILKTLMTLSDLRGGYGAGEVSVTKKGTYHVIKDNFEANDLISTKIFNDRMKDDISLVIGHSRWPTKGSQIKANAHPHQCGNIIGVHNGTFKSILEEESLPTENDSKKFFEAVSKVGIEEAISKSTGAYALMWIDKEVREFRILRNHERPLFIAYVKSHGNAKEGEFSKIFLSSERRMLVFALDRQGKLQESDIREVPVNKMLCFPHTPENYYLPEANVVDIPECKKYFLPKPFWSKRDSFEDREDWPSIGIPFQRHQSSVLDFRQGQISFRNGQFYDLLPSGAEVIWSKQKTAEYIKSLSREDRKNEVIPFCTKDETPLERDLLKAMQKSRSKIPDSEPLNLPKDFDNPSELMYETKKNFFVSLGKYEELLQKGCVWCADVPGMSSKESGTRPYFFSSTEFLCHECMKHEDPILLANIPLTEKRA